MLVIVQGIEYLDSIGLQALCVFFVNWVKYPLTIKVPGYKAFHMVLPPKFDVMEVM